MSNLKIDFMGKRFWLLGFSGLLMVVSIVALLTVGLKFGVEFKGGTSISFTSTGDITVEQMRDAFDKAGAKDAVIQQSEGQGGSTGIRVNTSESNPDAANVVYKAVVAELGLPADSGEVTTIGPGWGSNITNAALLALALSIAAILLYTSIRFEYKMAGTAVVALAHDVIPTLGIYALVGREVTPNTVAAILTIIGYSLYDTIVVFHRIRENSQRLVKQTFMDMANDSINQVIIRSLNTSLTSMIPVLTMLFFGGDTLKDFAFALTIGLISGAYSSIGVASPIYAIWKEREPKFQALKKKYARAS